MDTNVATKINATHNVKIARTHWCFIVRIKRGTERKRKNNKYDKEKRKRIKKNGRRREK
jgi:hypothetical protein